jgi:hypothetical protein
MGVAVLVLANDFTAYFGTVPLLHLPYAAIFHNRLISNLRREV